MRRVEFNKKVLMVGYGAVAQCALPILAKLIKVPLQNVTVIDFEDRSEQLKEWTKQGEPRQIAWQISRGGRPAD